MRTLAASLLLPLRQIGEPGFRRPLLKGLGTSVLVFGGLTWLADWGAGALAGGTGWIATLAGLLGGALVLVSAIWLFMPVMLGVANFFLDEVADAVERRFYPALPPAEGASLAAQLRASLMMSLRFLLLSAVVLPVAIFMPPLGAVLFWAIAAVSLGYGLFDGVAQRRMSIADARHLRSRWRFSVLAVGGVLAGFALIPFMNLLVPVLGTAAMTHLLHRRWHPGMQAAV